MKLEEALHRTLDFYGGNVPSTVTEYCSNYPKGLSRQVLKSKFGLTTGEFLAMLGSDYTPPNKARDLIQSQLSKKGLSAIETLDGKTTKCPVKLRCNTCEHEFSTSYESLKLSKKGCQKCAGNLPLYLRKEYVDKCAARVGSTVLEIPCNNRQKVRLLCSNCGEEYSITLAKLTHPQSKLGGTCPMCRSTDRRVVHNGMTFSSQFELDCFKLLEPLSPRVHVRYRDHFNTTRLWTCDFVVGDAWVEVSSFKQDYKNYFSNIEDKRQLVEGQGSKFVFLNSLEEVKSFIDMI